MYIRLQMHNNLSKIATEINSLLSILHVIINEFHIESRTKSETLKHYFNLKKSEFTIQFMDSLFFLISYRILRQITAFI